MKIPLPPLSRMKVLAIVRQECVFTCRLLTGMEYLGRAIKNSLISRGAMTRLDGERKIARIFELQNPISDADRKL